MSKRATRTVSRAPGENSRATRSDDRGYLNSSRFFHRRRKRSRRSFLRLPRPRPLPAQTWRGDGRPTGRSSRARAPRWRPPPRDDGDADAASGADGVVRAATRRAVAGASHPGWEARLLPQRRDERDHVDATAGLRRSGTAPRRGDVSPRRLRGRGTRRRVRVRFRGVVRDADPRTRHDVVRGDAARQAVVLPRRGDARRRLDAAAGGSRGEAATDTNTNDTRASR